MICVQFFYFAKVFMKRPWLQRGAFIAMACTWAGFPFVFVLAKTNDWTQNEVSFANSIMDFIAKTSVAVGVYLVERNTLRKFRASMAEQQAAIAASMKGKPSDDTTLDITLEEAKVEPMVSTKGFMSQVSGSH